MKMLVHKESEVFAKARNLARERMRKSPLLLMRAALSDKMYPRLRDAAFKVLKDFVKEISELAYTSFHDISDELVDKYTQLLIEAKRRYVYAMVEGGRELGEIEFGTKSIHSAQFPVFGKAIIGYDDDTFLLRNRSQDVEKYLETTSKLETRATRKKLDKIFKRSDKYWDPKKKRGLTPREIENLILKQGIADARYRASLMARTTGIWSYNEGAHQFYQESGVAAEEWLVTVDDLLCEFCEELDGRIVKTDDSFLPQGESVEVNIGGEIQGMDAPFDIQHPPLHPNCICVLIPVIS